MTSQMPIDMKMKNTRALANCPANPTIGRSAALKVEKTKKYRSDMSNAALRRLLSMIDLPPISDAQIETIMKTKKTPIDAYEPRKLNVDDSIDAITG